MLRALKTKSLYTADCTRKLFDSNNCLRFFWSGI